MNEQNNVANVANASNAGTTAMSIKHDDVSTGLKVLNLLDEKQLASAEVFLKKIIASDKGGIKSVNEGLAVLMRAQDLQLPFSICTEHIHVVNGKTGIDIHIIRSLLSRAGITWDCTKDYVPQYQYTDGNTIYLETQLPEYCVKCRSAKEAEEKTNDSTIGVYPLRYYTDLKGNIYHEFEISDKCVIALNKVQAMQLAQSGKFPIMRIAARPVDYVTEYEFTRYFMINGKEHIMKCKGHFSFTEAQAADFFTKDTYKKYPRIMIGIRAFTLGAREIASDVLNGAYEISELKIVNGQELDGTEFTEADVIL